MKEGTLPRVTSIASHTHKQTSNSHLITHTHIHTLPDALHLPCLARKDLDYVRLGEAETVDVEPMRSGSPKQGDTSNCAVALVRMRGIESPEMIAQELNPEPA